MNETAIVVFARMGSSRLPGKTLTDIGGRTVLGFLVDRLAYLSHQARIIVATSDQPADDAIIEFCRTDPACRDLNIDTFRGSHLDVLGRAAACARKFQIDPLVRISGDSPFMDPAIIDLILTRHAETKPDMTTNRFPRTFPPGITVEAVSQACLNEMDEIAQDDDDREHVTTYLYKNADRFSIENIEANEPGLESVNLTVDTVEDLAVARKLIAALKPMGGPIDYLTCVNLRRNITA